MTLVGLLNLHCVSEYQYWYGFITIEGNVFVVILSSWQWDGIPKINSFGIYETNSDNLAVKKLNFNEGW